MKSRIALLCMVTAIAACGARTPMDTCPEGAEQCSCLAGACNPGLVCVEDVCNRPNLVSAGGGGGAGSGGDVGSGGQMGSGGYLGSGGQVGSGGYVGSGGQVGSGGRVSSGGQLGSGGQVGSGGRFSSGGQLGSGGRVGSGGQLGSGGQFGSGGRVGSGGVRGSGGIIGSGGYAGGGRIGTGGVSGMSGGGRSGLGGSTSFVTFMNGQATGLMDGWGWASLGAKDTLYSPTCLTQPITAATPCTTMTTWSANNELCITGTIPPLPPSATALDYSDNWGIMVAAECQDPPGPLGASFKSLTIEYSGSPASGARAVVHRWGDPDAANYCAPITSNTPIAFTAFNTSCSDGSGTPLTLGDVANLDWIGLQVPSGPSALKVNLCWGAIFLVP